MNRAAKLAARLPDRAHRAFWALLTRMREVQSGIVYIGNQGLGDRVDRCGKTIQRAKPQLAASGLVIVHAVPGGKALNEFGQCVEQATGYEFAEAIFEVKTKSAPPPPPQAKPAPPPTAAYERFRELATRLRSRAGP